MPAVIDSINRFSTAWAGLMGAILWQSTLLVALVTLVALLARRASPRVRYWLWQIVTIKLLLMPFWVLRQTQRRICFGNDRKKSKYNDNGSPRRADSRRPFHATGSQTTVDD